MVDYDDIFADLFGGKKAPKPKTPSDEAFDLAKQASQIAAKFGRLSEKKGDQ